MASPVMGSTAAGVLAQFTSTYEPAPPDATDKFLDAWGAWVGAALLVVFLLAAVLGLARAQRSAGRVRDLRKVARHAGLRFSEENLGVNTGAQFRTFQQGDRRGAQNVMAGTIDGLFVQAFDFWFYYLDERRERDGGMTLGLADLAFGTSTPAVMLVGDWAQPRAWTYLTCALLSTECAWPHLTVQRENFRSKLINKIGARDLEFESEEFNRTYYVQCDDRQFAHLFLDAQMIDFLLRSEGEFNFEVRGGHMLCASKPIEPIEFPALMRLAADWRSAVSSTVLDMYPPLVPESKPQGGVW